MIGIFLGNQNSGKTLSMVCFAYRYYKLGYTIYANFKLKFPYVKLTKKLLLEYTEGKKQFNKAIFLIDEIYLFMDSRNPMDKRNKVISYFILQTSKRNVNLFGTAQVFGSVDLRFRNQCTFQCFCNRVMKINDNFYEIKTGIRKLKNNDRLYIKTCFLKKEGDLFNYQIRPKIRYIKAKYMFNLYDTTELMAID